MDCIGMFFDHETFAADQFADQLMIVAQGPDAVHAICRPRHAREKIVQIQEVKIDYPAGPSVRKNSEALGCKIFIYMAHF
jgi:hypothetical protein